MPPAEDELFEALRAMRGVASSQRLDMSDAFEEMCGTGLEKISGLMTKTRFRSTMGMLFHGNVSGPHKDA